MGTDTKILQPKGVDEFRLRKSIISLYHRKTEVAKATDVYNGEKELVYAEVSEYMHNNNLDSVSVEFEEEEQQKTKSGFTLNVQHKILKLSKITKRKIKFDVDKLETKFGKKFCKQFVKRNYVISDWQGVVNLLKSHDIKPEEFTKFVTVEKTVNEKELEQMHALGHISQEDLAGTYSVEESGNYIRMDETKK